MAGGGDLPPQQHAAMLAGSARGVATLKARRAAGLAFAREWRRVNGPKFDRLYGPDPHSTQTFPYAPWPGEAGW